MQADAIHERLIEWGRWVRLRPRQGHCLSIEHRYRRICREGDTPTGWGDWTTTPVIISLPAVDEFRALEVERVMRFIPDKHRLALILRFVYRVSPRKCCRELSLAYHLWDQHLDEAQNMVRNRLTFAKRAIRIIGNSGKPSFDEIMEPCGSVCFAEA